jgi:internalin A
MADLNVLRQIEQKTGQTFIQLEAEDFKKKDGERFKKQYAYALSPQGEIICLSFGTLYNQEILETPFDQFQDLSILYLFQIEVDNFNFLSKFFKLDQLAIIESYYSDFQSLKDFKGLTSLDLSDNNVTDFSFLKDIKSLTSLNLSDNNVTDFSFLKDFKGLSSLNLSFNSITDFSFLKDIKSLTSLNLSGNNITDFSFLKDFKGLSFLNLSDNKITDVSFLKDFKGLTSLDLSNNDITDFSFLKDFKGLSHLYLSGNYSITDVSFLKDLKSLSHLYLSGNYFITDVSFLKDLKSLSHLYLNGNYSITDFSFLKELKGLSFLNLSFNSITDFSFLKELKGLSHLDLSSSGNATDFLFLKDFKGLSFLNLSGNNITDVSFLKDLKGLSHLYLIFNNVRDVSFLKDLKGLSALDLRNNNIKELPRWLARFWLDIRIDLDYNFRCINIYNNPIQDPPIEIVKQGNDAILNYFTQLDTQGVDYLYEAKMLIVGEGEAGKTTLSYKIKDPNCVLPHIDDRTKGITIQYHKFPTTDKINQAQRQFQLNIWDFGGQEIYHYTHRFFLSKRSLYILVADNRKDDTDFNYWLNIIELFAGNSPMMIVLNEKGEIQRTVNQSELRGRFPESLKDVCPVNFKTKEETDPNKRTQRLRGIETLIRQIEFQAAHLPHIGEPIPARWVDVRQSIETDSRNHIYLEQFEELCQAQNIAKSEDIAVLLSYFHDLGILLHFDKNLLRDRVILKPIWATQAVYRILDHDDIKEKQGRFTRQDCAQIWIAPQYRNMQDVLIELMKNFQLIYEIAATGNLVAPQMLPPNAPTYLWTNEHNSRMQFRYDLFMPKGIFWIFVVNMYRYIVNHDWVWRNGVILEREGTRAEIIENLFERRIYLRFVGPDIPVLCAIIADELDQISKTFHNLKYEKMIPCNCHICVISTDPHFYKFSDLKNRLDRRVKNTVDCYISDETIPIIPLLEGFDRSFIPASPILSSVEKLVVTKSNMKIIKIFLASSSELKEDREGFEIFINRKNNEYIEENIFLKLNLWEDFLDAMSSTRLQDEYNKVVQSCDIVVSLFHTKVGKYTEEEFQKALEKFKADGKPLIYTYFKTMHISMNPAEINVDDITTLQNFQKKLKTLGHFPTSYQDINDLERQFSNQLRKLLPRFTQTND